MIRKIGFAIIGIPLLLLCITWAGLDIGFFDMIIQNKAIFWSIGVGFVMYSFVKDARILLILVLAVFFISKYLLSYLGGGF